MSARPSAGSAAPAAPLTMPRLVHFEPAEYPPAAAAESREASVPLRITLDAGGRVTKVEVVSPVGSGFDEAAVAAAQRFVFEPALRAGVPVRAVILYRYEFKIERQSVPVIVEPPAAAPASGELRGRIVAGTPPAGLSGVSVSITGVNGLPISVRTASDGSWVVPKLEPGDYVVTANATGFRPIRQGEVVRAGQVTALTYALDSADELPLEVTVRGGLLRRELTHYEIGRSEMLRMPGTLGDAVHAVEAMPSVARPRSLSGTLIVRGSGPADSQVYIEGTPVPHVFHYGGLSSVVPGEMIERLEFYPSNFSVRYGRAMGGVVEIRMRETNPDGRYHGSAQLDLLNARANVEGPLPKLPGFTFMGGVRASYFDRWLAPIMRDGAEPEDGLPRYQDYQLYIQRRTPQNGMYRLGIVGAHDGFTPILEHARGWYVPRRDSFLHLQSQLRLPLSPSLEFVASWSIGRNRRYAMEDERSSEIRETLGTLRSELSLKTGSAGIARVGTDVLYAPFEFAALTDSRNVKGELASAHIAEPDLERYDLRGLQFRPAAYLEYELAPTRRVDITSGLRLDYARDTHDLDVAPRIAARIVLVDSPKRTLLKGGLGLFYQPPLPSQTLVGFGTPSLPSSRAEHAMLGVEQVVTNHLTLSVEGFHKRLTRLIEQREDGSGNEIVEAVGRGRIFGADVLLRYHTGERFFGWVAYTASRSTRRAGPSAKDELDRYDQTHVLNLVASYRLGRGWELGGRFRYASGTVYRACFGGLYDNPTGLYRCYGEREQRRLAPFHQLDLRIEKAWELRSHRVAVYLDLINAYFRYSPDKAVFSYDYSQFEALSRSLPLLPSLGIRGEL